MITSYRRLACLGTLVLGLALSATPAAASTIWANWTAGTIGGPGSAAGSVGGVGVTYAGDLDGFVLNGTSPIWSPAATFVGGVVDTSPSSVGDDLRLNGSTTGFNVINFASPVVNPVFAIWSLGQPGLTASFNFTSTPTLVVGGPNSLFGGASISVLGNVVSGNEGNGVVQFTGTFNSITWTNSFENFYAFTVGVNDPAAAAVPEPASMMLLGTGLLGLLALRRRRA